MAEHNEWFCGNIIHVYVVSISDVIQLYIIEKAPTKKLKINENIIIQSTN